LCRPSAKPAINQGSAGILSASERRGNLVASIGVPSCDRASPGGVAVAEGDAASAYFGHLLLIDNDFS